jgi:hypothetical protein
LGETFLRVGHGLDEFVVLAGDDRVHVGKKGKFNNINKETGREWELLK